MPRLANFQGIFEQLPEGALLCDREGVVVAHNPRLADLVGLPSERIVGAKWATEDQPMALACLRAAVAGQPAAYDGTFRVADGQTTAAHVRAAPLRDEAGELHGALVLVAPLDRALYADVGDAPPRAWPVDRAPVPAYTWQRLPDGGFVLRDYNEAALAISRGRIPAFVGKSVEEIYGSDAEKLAGDMRLCFERGTLTRPEVTFKLATTGETRRFTITFAAVTPDTLIVYTEDVTERVRLAEQLRQAQKMDAIGQLAAGIAHDVNNVVAAIESTLGVLAGALGPESPHLQEVAEIRLAGAHAASLLRQLLALSRKQVPPQGSVDVGETARGLEPMLRHLVPDSIALVIQTQEGLHRVRADVTQIEQLVLNLALNARDAMPTGGTLTIGVANVTLGTRDAAGGELLRPGEYVELSVVDDGVGMDAATRERVFEPFFTTKAAAYGTGLGLSTVYGIARRSGGTVTIESEPGHGTTVRVRLPRAPDEAALDAATTAAATAGRPSPAGPLRILLVEDTGPVRRACRRTLASVGFDVFEAASDAEAMKVDAAIDGPLHLVLADVNIPTAGGRALFENLRGHRPGLRVLYMSGHSRDDMVRHGAIPPDAPFLQKPFAFAELVGAVRKVMAPEEPDVAAGARVR